MSKFSSEIGYQPKKENKLFAWQCACAEMPAYSYVLYGFVYDELRGFYKEEPSYLCKYYKSYNQAMSAAAEAYDNVLMKYRKKLNIIWEK